MEFRTLFLSLFLSMFAFGLKAQQQVSPNLIGNYILVSEEGALPKDFDAVIIEANAFSLRSGNQIVRNYMVTNEIKGGFSVEQIGSTTDFQDTFNVIIESMNGVDLYISIHYPQGSEKIHLQKLL